jgi:hypothetical protein
MGRQGTAGLGSDRCVGRGLARCGLSLRFGSGGAGLDCRVGKVWRVATAWPGWGRCGMLRRGSTTRRVAMGSGAEQFGSSQWLGRTQCGSTRRFGMVWLWAGCHVGTARSGSARLVAMTRSWADAARLVALVWSGWDRRAGMVWTGLVCRIGTGKRRLGLWR